MAEVVFTIADDPESIEKIIVKINFNPTCDLREPLTLTEAQLMGLDIMNFVESSMQVDSREAL